MENLDNLMDFNNTVRNISPNSKFMKPLITPLSTPLRVRTVSDPARLSLDNNPFDKALREIQLKTVEDDPFEKVLKASLNPDDEKGKDLEIPNIVLNEANLFCEQIGIKTIVSPSIFDIIPECIACHCKKDNRSSTDISCLCNMNISNCTPNEPSDHSSINSSSRSIFNTAVRYSSSEMSLIDRFNSTSDSQQSSIMNKGFTEEFISRSASEQTSAIDCKKDLLETLIKNRSKSAHSSIPNKLTRENTFAIESPVHQADLNITVFEEANDIVNDISQMKITVASDLGSKDNSLEDLLSVEPVWSDTLSDIEITEKDPELKDDLLSKDAMPEAKKLLCDVRELLESKEIQKKAFDDVLCRLSKFCSNLKQNNEISSNKNVTPINKNMNTKDTKKTPNKLPLPKASKNVSEVGMGQKTIPQFLKCLQETSNISDSSIVNELIIKLRILHNEKLSKKKENSMYERKIKTPQNARIRRSNSVNNQRSSRRQNLNTSLDSCRPMSKSATNNEMMSKNTVKTAKSDKKTAIKTKSLIPNAVKPKLQLNSLSVQSASKFYRSSITDDLKLDLKTSTPNMDLYYHNSAFAFSTPGKRDA